MVNSSEEHRIVMVEKEMEEEETRAEKANKKKNKSVSRVRLAKC